MKPKFPICKSNVRQSAASLHELDESEVELPSAISNFHSACPTKLIDPKFSLNLSPSLLFPPSSLMLSTEFPEPVDLLSNPT